jgi:uncharacterized protein
MEMDEPRAWDAPEDYLMSDRSPPDCMQISDLDGFLTAVALCPEIIPADEWTAVIWGDEAPFFADDAEMTAVLNGITGRYNEILSTIEDGTYQPILWIDVDDLPLPSDWAEGFLIGVGMRPKLWRPLLASKSDGHMMFPIVALGSEEISDLMECDDVNRLWDEAEITLPASVIEIAAYWRRRKGPNGRSASKQGRNDPCACGSGRKFKKCCGAAA